MRDAILLLTIWVLLLRVWEYLHNFLNKRGSRATELPDSADNTWCLERPFVVMLWAPAWEEFLFRLCPIGAALLAAGLTADSTQLWVINTGQALVFVALHEASFKARGSMFLDAFADGAVLIYFFELFGIGGLLWGTYVCFALHAGNNALWLLLVEENKK